MPSVTLTVNGAPRTVEVQPDSKLLWLVRDTLGLTGAKYGCGEGRAARVPCWWTASRCARARLAYR